VGFREEGGWCGFVRWGRWRGVVVQGHCTCAENGSSGGRGRRGDVSREVTAMFESLLGQAQTLY
jgi:hypothetical protein